MRKLLSVAFVLATAFNAFGNAAFAQNERLTLLESLDNLQKLESYTMQQVISGDLSAGDEEGLSGSGNFRLNVKSAIVNHDELKMDVKHTVEVKVHVTLLGEDRPFNTLGAMFKFSVIALADQGAYVRLENTDFNAEGIPEKDLQDYLDFKDDFHKAVEPLLWQWIQLPADYLKGQVDQNAPTELGALDTQALKDELLKNGFKMAIRKAIEDEIATSESEGTMTAEESAKARALADQFFETEFFSLKTSAKKGQEEQTSFKLNKGKILQFLQRAGEEMGETISEDDLGNLRDALKKITLLGIYHQNRKFNIFDRLRINLTLRDIADLDHLKVGYASKVGNINAVETIKAPTKSIPLEEANLDFLPPVIEPSTSELDAEPLPSDGM